MRLDLLYFKGANAILQNTICIKISIIEHWLATILKILMKPLILAKILFAKIHLSSNDYATYYSWLPDKSNPGMLRMLTKEQLEQKNISSELVCRIRFTLVISFLFQPPLHAILVKDVFQIITSDIVIAKIDIEGYECKVRIQAKHFCW